MDKDTSEIAKLTERMSKDPKSKLFVPLAEEYKKTGDIEMSIHVLTEGLKNNPGYVTARSFLGKLLFEKGDLSGAQKELEEVAKAIPDNLMAQRKLGDIYVLLDKPADALMRFKTVLSLNPKDQETAALVSDMEAGRDVKPRIAAPRPQVQAEAQKKESPPQAAQPQTAAKTQPSSVSAALAATGSPSTAAEEVEEAEEVLVVEPLDEVDAVNLEEAFAAENLGILSEPEALPQAPEQEKDGGVLVEPPEPFAGQATPEVKEGMEFPGVEPGLGEIPAFGEIEKSADDFTTDTLAELYISQGFYEKAVEIYERMLVDNPASQGLKDKLASVRSMAAQAAPAAEQKAEEREPFASPEEFVPAQTPREIPPTEIKSGFFDEFEAPSSDQEKRLSKPGEEWSPPAHSTEIGEKGLFPGPASGSPKQFDAGFEPVEYVPPVDTSSQPGSEETSDKTADEKLVAAKTGDASSPRKPTGTGRKETIDRLETWLQHIMKEK